MEFKKGVQGAVLDPGSLSCFCERHGPVELIQGIKQGIIKTRLYFEYLDSMTSSFAKSTGFKVTDNNSNTNAKRWKTSKGTPIAPNYFIKVLDSFLVKFKIENHGDLAQLLTRYWSMKREMKRGAPLIRRVNDTITGGDPNEIPSKLEFSKILLDDLTKLNEINDLIIQRESLKLTKFETLKQEIEMAYFHQSLIIQNLLAKIIKIDSTRFLMNIPVENNLDQIMQKSQNKEYRSVNDFITELSTFFQQVELRNDNREIKSKNRILREIANDLELFVNWDDLIQTEITKDFNIKGLDIDKALYRGLIAQKEEELSDVEDTITVKTE
jgi:NuA3 HAT complex component NTO1